MDPIYIPGFIPDLGIGQLLNEIGWEKPHTRQEAFQSDPVRSYIYGSGRGVRTYTSTVYQGLVKDIMERVNEFIGIEHGWAAVNGCFLRPYEGASQHLGWHADNFVDMDPLTCIAALSFGQAREIWWRPFGFKGEIPASQRQLLEHGSLFLMRPGMQKTHEHRIPKGDREMGLRVSLTYRRLNWRADAS